MSAALPKVLDHADQGVARLLTQYRRRPLIDAWARAYLNQVQKLEDACWEVIIARFIDSAVGDQLDMIGRIVGELRHDRIDVTYRVFIRARIRINRSKGNTKDVLDVLNIITAAPLFFREYQPACLFIQLNQIADEDVVLLYGQLRDTKAGGVKLVLIAPTTNTEMFLPRSVGAIVTTNDPTHACGDGLVTKGSVTTSAAQPFALTEGMVLTFDVDGVTKSVTFTNTNSDFISLAAATAAEVVAYFNKQGRGRRSGLGAFAAVEGAVTLKRTFAGAAHSLQVAAGGANAVLVFDTTLTAGTGDTSYGLLSDAVTLRDPNAEPIAAPPGAPTILYLDPPTDAP